MTSPTTGRSAAMSRRSVFFMSWSSVGRFVCSDPDVIRASTLKTAPTEPASATSSSSAAGRVNAPVISSTARVVPSTRPTAAAPSSIPFR